MLRPIIKLSQAYLALFLLATLIALAALLLTLPGHPAVLLVLGGLLGGLFGWQIARAAQPLAQVTDAAEQLTYYQLLAGDPQHIILFIRLSDGHILEANAAAVRAYGYSYEELRARTISDLRAGETQKVIDVQMQLADKAGIIFEAIHQRADGSTFPVEVHSVGAEIAGVRLLQSIVHDISARRGLQATLDQERSSLDTTNHTLRTLQAANHALINAGSELELIERVCAILIEGDSYVLAWVGFAEQEPPYRLIPIAAAGLASALVPRLDVTWGEGPRGQGPTGQAVRSGQTVVIHDLFSNPDTGPWIPLVREYGLAAVASLPLILDGRVIGALSVSATRPDAFAPGEVSLLEGLAGDLAYGIGARRIRLAQQQADEELRQVLASLEQRVAERTAALDQTRRRLEEELGERAQIERILREREQFIQKVADAVPVLIFLYDLDVRRNFYSNRALSSLLGYAPADVAALGERLFEQLMHPEDLADLDALHKRLHGASDNEVVEHEYRLRHADGSWRWMSGRDSVFRRAPDGQAQQILGMALDITARKHAELALIAMNSDLQASVGALEQRTRELSLLSGLGALLQRCATSSEALGVIAQSARALFPQTMGTLSIRRTNNPGALLEPVVIWGDPPLTEPFAPDTCWGLRRGRLHLVGPSQVAPICAHTALTPDQTALCVPLQGQRQTYGLLQIILAEQPGETSRQREERQQAHRRLAVAFADHITLALSSLPLRETA
jgi:PAS domain S-box-containing protein